MVLSTNLPSALGSATLGVHLVSLASTSVAPNGGGAPGGGFGPSQIAHAYGFDQITFNGVVGDGRGQTIALIEAYDQPNIVSDLAAFDSAFGIAAPPTFTRVNETGGTSYPTSNGTWGLETSLDVEWAHAMAPGANILLVEATTNNWSDLFTAIDYARKQANVSVVSMSFGGLEWSGETSYDNHFTTPSGHNGVTFVASSGDSGSSGAPNYPSVSPNVLAVGGTQLTVDSSNNWSSETGWGGSGGGISAYESQPGYQKGVVTQSSNWRTVPDVAYNGSSSSPFGIYDTSGYGGWVQVYGTSAGAPQWASLIAIADQGRAANSQGTLDGFSQTLPKLYSIAQSDFHDITTGNNGGYSAGQGYDLVTGRGTPYANLIANDLIDPAGSGNKPPTVATPASASPNPVTGTTTNLSVLGADDGGESNLTYTWTVTSEPSGAASPTYSANGTNAAKNTTATFYAAGSYTFQVTITDSGGLSVTSSASVTVNQTLTGVSVAPGKDTLAPNASQQFVASAVDQFGKAMASQPAFTWSLSGIGTLNSSGLYTAPGSTGTATVKAAASAMSSTAAVTVTTVPAAPTNLTATAVSKRQVNLAWQETSSNQTGFIIQRSPDGTNWKQIASVGATVLTYKDNSVSRHTAYYYRVEAYNSLGNSPWSNVANVVTPSLGVVLGPTGGSSHQVQQNTSTIKDRASVIQNRFAARILAGLKTVDTLDSLPQASSGKSVLTTQSVSSNSSHQAAVPAARLQTLASQGQANARAFAEHQSSDFFAKVLGSQDDDDTSLTRLV
jgi:subtilase family serine protease